MAQYTFTIWHDQDAESPLWDDSAVRMVVLHRRLIDPAKGTCGRTPDDVMAWERKNRRSWHVLPLWLYDHSATVYRAAESNPFSCPWDSGRVGILALRKKDFGRDWRKAMDSICETYTQWANGECYGFTVEDSDGETVDSCGGFYGREDAEQAARDAIAALVEEPA